MVPLSIFDFFVFKLLHVEYVEVQEAEIHIYFLHLII